MKPHLLFFAVETIGLFAVVLLGSRLIVSAPARRNVQLAALICLNAACARLLARQEYSFWIPAAYDIDVGMLASPMNLLRNMTPGLFMVLCHSLFREGRRLPRWLLGAFVAQCLLEEPVPLLLGSHAAQYDLLKVMPASLQLLFVCFGMYWTLSGWRADLVEDRRRLRKIFIAIVGTFVFAMILGERLLIPWQSAALFDLHITLSMVGALLSSVMLWIMFRPDAAAYLDPFRSEGRVAVERPPDDSDLESLRRVLDVERVYHDSELTVASLAARVAIPEYRLRRVIHERLQYRNFNALLHRYRIEEACVLLADAEQRHLPILTIALTVGYNSINPFNRAFRELKGMTPSEFRARAFADS
ncbi:MAG TPA: helix-turn-helix transcriptional regulator [Steroidobacteraceae bacterium]|jgi:AraC-like DNA-binding protein|nr:helix-turn-helix transcriptional regulator [Steroidobacteraceae bacterium]